jgi:hypothetical protein
MNPALRLKTALVGAVLAVTAAIGVTTPASAQTIVTIQQVSNNRFVDAHEHAGEDFRVVTRAAQNNNTQLWIMTHVSGQVYTFQQLSNGRYLDAHEHSGEDYRLVTRPAQNNPTQQWLLTGLGGGIYTIQQVSNGRYVDAHEHAGEDYRLVTRTAQNNATQQWRITQVIQLPPQQPPQPPVPPVYSSGSFQLLPSARVDVDNGQFGFNGLDLSYQPVTLSDMQLAPMGGAMIYHGNGIQQGYLGCVNVPYSSNPVPLSALAVGSRICVQTGDGRISQLRIDGIGQVLRVLSISYTTWQ